MRFWGHVRQAASARSEVSPEGSAIRDMRKGATSRQHAVYLCSKRVHVSHRAQYSNECVAGNEALVGRFQAAFNKARLRQALQSQRGGQSSQTGSAVGHESSQGSVDSVSGQRCN